MAEFIDYKRGPGFWFLFQILIAVDVCKNPLLSARYVDLLPIDPSENLYESMDEGLKIYELIQRKKVLLGGI